MIRPPPIPPRSSSNDNDNTLPATRHERFPHRSSPPKNRRILPQRPQAAHGRRFNARQRFSKHPRFTTNNLYYSASWQVLQSGASYFVWSPVYVDALVCRDLGFQNGPFALQRVYCLQDAQFNSTAMVQVELHLPDITGDGNNDIQDLNTVTSHWHNTVGNGPASGDFNSDGYVDDADLNAVLANWQQHGIALPTQWTVSQRLVYTVHGEFAAFDGDFNTGVNFLGWQPTFKGGIQDALTGNINFDYRDYNPRTCTWNTSDPIQAGMNWYEAFADNPINRMDPTGLTIVTSPEKFPGSTQGPGGNYTMNVPDGSTSTKALHRITEAELQAEEQVMADRLRAFEKSWGTKDRRKEGAFDTKFFIGVGTEREYYLVQGMDRIYADNEINYIGIGMYERWLGDYCWEAKLITRVWKLQYEVQGIPTPSGTWYWLEKGYNDFPNMPAGPGGGPDTDRRRDRDELRRDRRRG